jgi:hypothetical protein
VHRGRNLWTTRAPRTFNEKVRYRMARDRRRLLVTFADKVAVRHFVEERAGAGLLPLRHAAVGSLRDVDRAALPRQFVVKASHVSGAVVIVWDGAPESNCLPPPGDSFPRVVVRPSQLDWDALTALTDRWLQVRFEEGPYGEWAYWDVPPMIVIEELLLDGSGRLPDDFKWYVFDGVCAFVNVITDRFEDYRDLWFTPDWEQVRSTSAASHQRGSVPRPDSLPRMIAVAEALGRGIDFVRVDLYDCGGKVVFGELTNYPAAGKDVFPDPRLDIEMGRAWRLPNRRTLRPWRSRARLRTSAPRS